MSLSFHFFSLNKWIYKIKFSTSRDESEISTSGEVNIIYNKNLTYFHPLTNLVPYYKIYKIFA
jgi:hypothetical protein